MIKHIVMFTFKEHALQATAAENRLKARDMLLALSAQIPELRTMEVGLNMATAATAFDLVLTATYDTPADLQTYVDHPAHQKVTAFMREAASARAVVDYEC